MTPSRLRWLSTTMRICILPRPDRRPGSRESYPQADGSTPSAEPSSLLKAPGDSAESSRAHLRRRRSRGDRALPLTVADRPRRLERFADASEWVARVCMARRYALVSVVWLRRSSGS
jgi:hypothetical protein